MPVRKFLAYASEHAGDVVGGIGGGLAISTWLQDLDVIINILLGIGGLVALFYSARLNSIRYDEIKEHQEDAHHKETAREQADNETEE